MSSPTPGERAHRSGVDGAKNADTRGGSLEVGVRESDGSSLTIRRDDPVAFVLAARDAARRSRARVPSHPAAFTPRQRQILSLVADGSSNAEIAATFGISRRTVEKHLEAIHAKAGTATRARLVAFARDHERIDSP